MPRNPLKIQQSQKPRHRLSTGFAFIAAVLAMIGMSSPVLAAYYDSPGFTGGASNGYNAYQQRDQ
jgi:hypothetical protein